MIEFSQPTVDALYHHLIAKSIAAGALTSPEPFFRAPFYNYFLGFIYWITSDSIGAARFIQLLIGTSTAPLTFVIAREAIDRRAAFIASLLVLLCQDIVYFEAELLLESILITLILLSIYCLLRYLKHRKWTALILSGLFAGLSIITRPNAAVLLLPLLWLIWREGRELPGKNWGSAALALVLTTLVPVGLVLAHNLTRPQPAFTIATQGGINFYIGNSKHADGVSAVMPGKLGFNWQYDDIAYAAEQAEGRKLNPSAVSSYYYSQALHDIAANPVRWIGLLVKKTYLFFSGADISNNRDLTYFKSRFFVFKILPIGMWLLAPFGLAAFIFWKGMSRRARALLMFVVLYAGTFILFFVNSRFRLPLLPILAIISSVTLVLGWERLRARQRIPAVAAGIAAIVLLVGLNSNLYGIQFDNRKQALFSEGNLQLRANSVDKALSTYLKAADLPGTLKDLNLNIGVVYLKKGDYDSAWKYLLMEDSLEGGSAEALSNLSYLYRQTKQYDEAVASAELALEEKPYLTAARLNLWYAWRDAGKSDSVLAAADSLSKSQQLTTKERFIRAVSATDVGKFRQAAQELHGLLNQNQKNTQPAYAEASSASGTSLSPPISKAHILYNLGYSMAGMGDVDSAIVLFREALNVDASLQEAWINLGTAYLSKKQFEDAVTAYNQGLRVGPATEPLLYNLALATLSLGNRVEGENYLRQALKLDPDFAPAKALLKKLNMRP